MKKIGVGSFLMTFVLIVSLAGAGYAGKKTIKEELQELGFLNEFPITNIEVKGIFTEEEIFREFLAFSWGKDGKYRRVVPMFMCEFKTGTEASIKVVCKKNLLSTSAKNMADTEASLNAVLEELMNVKGVLKFVITLTPEQRMEARL